MNRSMTVNWIITPITNDWPDYEEDVGVWVSVSALEASFRRSDEWVGPGGSGQGRPGRYSNIGKMIRSGIDIFMPTLTLDYRGEAVFTDGRHRFAWVRDHGAEAIMIATGPAEAAKLEELFGTNLRTCQISLP